MDQQRVVITGVGVVAPNGIGKEEFWANCAGGVSGIKPITLFDVSKYRCKYAGEVSNFHPEKYLGSKGLRNLDRTTMLSLVAAKLAIEDAGLEITDENRDDIGVVLGSTMGSVHSISEFDKEGLREGPRYVSPAHFPNTVINSPASQVAIRFGLRGLNSTISTGFSASLDAIGYAMDMLRFDRAKTLLVGGVEELCIQTFLGFYKLGFLATSQNGSPPLFCPFHAQRCGALLGEGAAFFILELLEHAQARDAKVYAELLSFASQFHPDSLRRYDSEAKSQIHVIRESIKAAELSPADIDSISACANSTQAVDAMEQKAFDAVFGIDASDIPISAVKSVLGESFSASGAFQLAMTVGSLMQQGVVVKTCGPDLHMASEVSDKNVLVNSFGPTGISSALIVSETSEA